VRAGVPMETRHLKTVTDVPVPSVIHFKSQHYSAVVDRREGGFLLRDPAVGGEMLMTADALRDEASGYVLVPRENAAGIGRAVPDSEADNVLGHCMPGLPWDDEPCGCNNGGAGGGGGNGGGGGGGGGRGSGSSGGGGGGSSGG